MNREVIVDDAARQSALDVTRSFIVQAPAGSGKTGLLTQRFLSLLAQADEPEEILAITFTHKAAGEMRNRIFASLERAHDSAPPEREHERLTWDLARKVLEQSRRRQWDLMGNASRLQVQTIDSLCASLTRQMPLLSAFGTQPSVSEDADRLYFEAARNALAEIESGEAWTPHIERLLKHLDNNLVRIEELLADMLARRDHWLRHLGDRQSEHLRRSTLESVLHHIIEEHLQVLEQSVPVPVAEELVAVARIAAGSLHEQGAETPLHACLELQKFPGHRVAHLPVWQGLAYLLLTKDGWRKAVNKNIGFPPTDTAGKKRMQDLLASLQSEETFCELLSGIADLPSPGYSENQWEILEALVEILPIAVGHLEVVFSAHGRVDFTEIAQRAVQALGDSGLPTDLALALDYRIHHILVDEFQDTSLSQYQLLERLTAEWSGGDGRTLFLVGDPMQSIYRFREAEVALYLRARNQGIGSISLVPLKLSVNFRSQALLVDWFNEAFQKIFPASEDLTSGAVSYTDSRAYHPGEGNQAVSVQPLFTENPVAEASRVVEIVQRVRNEQPDETVAILVRARSHLQAIVRALTNADIGFRAVEIEHLGERQPVLDLVSLTRALMHPGDRVAWLAVLRAPWCGLGLGDLEILLAAGGEKLIWQIIRDSANHSELSVEDKQRLSRTVRVLSDAMNLRQNIPLSEWVEGTWLALGGPASLERKRDISDCEQYFRLLRSMESEGIPITVNSLQTRIGKLFANTDPESDEHVQVMTIHKSKGLEFDTVILPGLGRKPPSRTSHLLNWAERTVKNERSELILAPIPASDEDRDSINTYLQYLERAREQNESSRLLYVASTRARRRLFIFGHVKTRNDGEAVTVQPPVSGSLLSTLWPAVEPIFAEAAFAMQAPDDATVSAPKVSSWLGVQGINRLPATWTPPVEFQPVTPRKPDDEAPVEYSWVGPSARHIGTVVHRLLEAIVHFGIQYWSVISSDTGRANIRGELMSLGVGRADLENGVATVLQAVEKTILEKRGIWILDNRHEDSHCEYALESIDVNNTLMTSVIDRTFIDDDGTRWIIDYKTSVHSGGGKEEFLDREMERYQSQLNRYARMMRQVENKPIKLGLYFPLLGGWREWDYCPD